MKKILYLIFLSTTFVFSQVEKSSSNDVDSLAYYENAAQYHLDRSLKAQKISDIALVVSASSLGVAAILGFYMVGEEFSRFGKSDKSGREMTDPLAITDFSLLGVSVVSITIYGIYGYSAKWAKEDSDLYHEKAEKCKSKHLAKISVIPLVDPINKIYGGSLALAF